MGKREWGINNQQSSERECKSHENKLELYPSVKNKRFFDNPRDN